MHNQETRRRHYEGIARELSEKIKDLPDVREKVFITLTDAITAYRVADENTRHLILDSYCEIICLFLQEAAQIGAAQARSEALLAQANNSK